MSEKNKPQIFTLDEICSLTEIPKRTVRFYMQISLVDRPVGQKRAAKYTEKHLEQLLFITKWQQSGLSLERIGELLKETREPENLLPRKKPGHVEVRSHLLIAPGVELQIEPSQAQLDSEQIRLLFNRVMQLYDEIKTGDQK